MMRARSGQLRVSTFLELVCSPRVRELNRHR